MMQFIGMKLTLAVCLLGGFSQVHAATIYLQCSEDKASKLCLAVEDTLKTQYPDLTILQEPPVEPEGFVLRVEEFFHASDQRISGRLVWWLPGEDVKDRRNSPLLEHAIADGKIDDASYTRLARSLLRTSDLPIK